uniref:Torsin-1A C-terminal domain-containing protein n=1 Tax=Magallana gigas TaxID=29159 RepID=A0A8W8KRY4_MAGGI|nr:torsin-1A-like [Crassostrea gigas]
MNFVKLVMFYGVITYVSAIEPFSALGAIGTAVIAGIYTVFTPIKCQFKECCTSKWISLNTTALQEDLRRRLYGQHLVTDVIIKHLKSHMTKDPSKALTLSFHGGTGTGKNYVSKIIAESIYKEGMRSKYVHLISATKEFPHKDMVPLYKDKLRNLVESSVNECPQSLFIFDEIDKMPAGILDTLKPYFDFYEQLGGTDYRKAMFIFLSNTAGEDISKHALNNWHSEFKREDIGLKEMEQIISTAAINSKTSGMYHSDIIYKHMITAYVPFLPMERKHIKECIKDLLVARNYFRREDIPEDKIRVIAQELNYYPADMEIFSVTGCKRVPEKVTYVMDEE